LDILTVGIVTTPFSFEGKKRKNHADEGIEQLKKSVDCLLIISNDKIKEMYGNLPLRQAFSHANDILTTAAKGIAELITDTGYINVDFEDVKTVMRNSGVALMGSASADGENRAIDAVKAALASPLLNDNQIVGAKNILLNISSGTQEVLMDEVELISSYIQDEAGLTADVIFGTSFDETLGDKIAVTLIATGFETRENIIVQSHTEPRTKHVLYEQPRKPDMVISHLLDEPKPEVTPIPAPEPVAEITPEPIEEIAPEPIIPQEEEIHFELKIEEEETFDIEPQITFETEDDEIKSRVQDAIARDEEIASITSEIHFELPVEEEIDEMPTMNMEEQELRIEQHIQRIKELKNLNVTINSPGGIRDLEKEPAYKRRNKKLNDVPHSSESQVSRLTLFEDTTNKAGIRTNNSFLHDNVD
jgi:cell division protein FtsZ